MLPNSKQRIAIIVALILVAVIGAAFGHPPDATNTTTRLDMTDEFTRSLILARFKTMQTEIDGLRHQIKQVKNELEDMRRAVKDYAETAKPPAEEKKTEPATEPVHPPVMRASSASGKKLPNEEKIRCQGTAKSTGKQCKLSAQDDSNYCRYHEE